jgi:TIR domain
MAYVDRDFKHDIFISYAHGPKDVDGEGGLKLWSSELHKALLKELQTADEFEHCDVYFDDGTYRDSSIDKHQGLTGQLKEAIENSAFLLVLMSPSYLKSSWCADERNWFLNQVKARPIAGVAERVFIARVIPVADKDWPKEFCDERGFPRPGVSFFNGPIDAFTRPVGYPDPRQDANKFSEVVLALLRTMAKPLRDFREALDLGRSAELNRKKLTGAGGQKLFFHAKEPNMDRWCDAFRNLTKYGFGVVPLLPEKKIADPEQEEAVTRKKWAVEEIAGCDGLLILAGDDPRSLSYDVLVVGGQWRNSAKARANRPLPCAVIDPGIHVMAEFRNLWGHSLSNMGIDWIDAVSPDWPVLVQEWLNRTGEELGL